MAKDKKPQLDDLIKSDNIADLLTEEQLTNIGEEVCMGYAADKASRGDWEIRYKEAMNLALQVMEGKTFPWPNASNVKFPIITMAAVQYHARAYPAIIPSNTPVGCSVVGDDPDGKKTERARRVSEHMSYQLMEEHPEWEEGTDKALLVQAIVGCAFKKTYYDAVAEIKKSELVLPKDLVVDYYTKSLSSAARITHVIELSRNQCEEREREGIYREISDMEVAVSREGPIEAAQDKRQGLTAGQVDSDTPVLILEQHRWLDLDDDGYKEPYIVVVQENTKKVLRIVARYSKENCKWSKDRELVSIRAEDYFTKIPFIPSPDGGFYDIGFGALLGGVGHAIDTLINQLIDAGTMQTTKGGFLGRGVKIRGGDYSFKPNEWKRTDSTGEDLQKNIVPLPVGEPSAVLFQLLGMLIDIGQKIGMATDQHVGENPGQNTPAETSRNTIAQGQKVFNAIYKRVYRAMKEEFRKLYRLNYLYPPENGVYDYSAAGQGASVSVKDYFPSDKGICPTADPYITSHEEAERQANDLMAVLESPLGQKLNPDEVLKRILTSRRVANTQALLNHSPPPQPPPDPKIVVAQMEQQFKQQELQFKAAELQAKIQQQMAELAETQRVNTAKVDQLESQAALFVSQAQGEADYAQIGLINAQVSAAKLQNEQLDMQQKEMHHQRDTVIAYLEHLRNVEKDKNDANKARV